MPDQGPAFIRHVVTSIVRKLERGHILSTGSIRLFDPPAYSDAVAMQVLAPVSEVAVEAGAVEDVATESKGKGVPLGEAQEGKEGGGGGMRGESHTHCDSGMLVSLVSMWVHPPLVTPPHVFKGGVTPRPPTPSDDEDASMAGEASWWLPEDLDWVTATTATLLTASR